MFAETIARAVQAARTDELDHLAREIWRAHGAGVLDDAGAQAAAEAIQAQAARPEPVHGARTKAAAVPGQAGQH